jgi:GNAT acetyltransferase-like protein
MSGPLPADNSRRDSRLSCFQLDPTKDARWSRFVELHPKASVFHTVGWLRTLQHTYGYEPLAFTTSPPDTELENGIAFCYITSWLTGRRLVSLPFSDHCELLCGSTEELKFLFHSLQTTLGQQNWKYLEVRPIDQMFGQLREAGFRPGAKHFLHRLDLRLDLADVFASLDKDSVQRRIQHAERAGLIEKCGRSEDLLRDFYRLFVITRGRHQLPPTPYAWFQNLIQGLGEALEIRIAYKDGTPAAAILTLRFKDVLYYKYGSSDARFHKLGATPWLLWNAISAAKLSGANEFDMGRTEEGNTGLLTFKNHWVPTPTELVYWNYPEVSGVGSVEGWKMKVAKRVFSFMPRKLMALSGRLVYRHIG